MVSTRSLSSSRAASGNTTHDDPPPSSPQINNSEIFSTAKASSSSSASLSSPKEDSNNRNNNDDRKNFDRTNRNKKNINEIDDNASSSSSIGTFSFNNPPLVTKNNASSNNNNIPPIINNGSSSSSSHHHHEQQQQRHIEKNIILSVKKGGTRQDNDKSSIFFKWWKSSLSSSTSSSSSSDGIVKILIPNDDSIDQYNLGWCIVQALRDDDDDDDKDLHSLFWDRDAAITPNGPPIAGLFRESDHLFIPLSDICRRCRNYEHDVLCLKRPTNEESSSSSDDDYHTLIIVSLVMMIAVVVGFIISPRQWLWNDEWWSLSFWWRLVREGVVMVVHWVDEEFVEVPLRTLYRNGPSIIGWEGTSLPVICSRMTFYGDINFWSKNLSECETIYAAKEQSFLIFWKPVLYAGMGLVFFACFRSLIRVVVVAGRRGRKKDDVDENMVEMYKAVTLMVKQLKRAMMVGG